MSKLIQMRQRIKAIETIKKITHAMRLISMSSHSRLKHKHEPLKYYLNTIKTFFNKIYHTNSEWKNHFFYPSSSLHTTHLVIIVGSQKGLCKNFNTNLYQLFLQHIEQYKSSYHFISIGKKITDLIHEDYPNKVILSFPELKTGNFLFIGKKVIETILDSSLIYGSITVVSNLFKGFFLQKPHISHLIPFEIFQENQNNIPLNEEYLFDHNINSMLDFIAIQQITAQLQYILFESLLSEHAARFISMDSSTRNAKKLLDTTRLEYNKLRQAKITKELAELTGSFE